MYILVYLKGKEKFRQKEVETIEDARKCICEGHWEKYDNYQILDGITDEVIETGEFKCISTTM